MNGFVLIDKHSGCTSHDIVNQWRKLAQTKRVGHLGTLDPMATGLLIVMTGSATRLAQFYGQDDKVYEAEIQFGLVSDTYDAEGTVTAVSADLPNEQEIRSALGQFEGRFLQMPPRVSAKKINGVPAYKLARRKVEVELKAVEVEVKQLKITGLRDAALCVEITCAAGTYIRSIAHDLGQALGCGAILTRLRRTRIGEFTVEQALPMDELRSLANLRNLEEAVIPAGKLLSQIPAEHFGLSIEAQIRQGRQFRSSPFVVSPGSPFVRALSQQGDLIAIGRLIVPNLYHPETVLQSDS